MSDKINPCGVCGADHLLLTLECPPPSRDYERGRAAGYAEAIEKADEIEKRMMHGARNAEEICDNPKAAEVMKHFAEGAWKVGRAIRAIAPATTRESK